MVFGSEWINLTTTVKFLSWFPQLIMLKLYSVNCFHQFLEFNINAIKIFTFLSQCLESTKYKLCNSGFSVTIFGMVFNLVSMVIFLSS